MALGSLLSLSAPVFLEGQWKLETLGSSEKHSTQQIGRSWRAWASPKWSLDVPLQSTPLWHKDCRELKTVEK